MTSWPPLLVRCDAGGDHGLGHLMRCLALAEALRAAGGPVARFCLQAPDAIVQRVRDAGFSVQVSARQAGRDCDDLVLWCQQNSADGLPWVVLDGKSADPALLSPLAEASRLICYDDAPYRDFPAAVIINAQPWTSATDYPLRAGRLVLAGGQYNSIHPGYFAAADRPARSAVLITLGGEDPANDTAWIARTLADELRGFPVLAVIGPAHPDRTAACAALTRFLPQSEIIHAPPSLIPVAERSFLALSAGGTSCYELQAAGIAVAAIAVEEHQVPFVAALERLGGVVPLAGPAPTTGDRPVTGPRAILHRLLHDREWRNERIARGRALFPAPGGQTLARVLMEHLR